MADNDTFADFVAVRSPRLLRTAFLLTRDWALAEDLLQTALVKAWGVWRRRRIVRRRRALMSTVAAAAAVVAVIAGLAFTPRHRSAPHPAATPSPSPSGFAFPEYARGTHVVVTGRHPVADGPLTLVWTPTSLKPVYFAQCTYTGSDTLQLLMEMRINGHLVVSGGCSRRPTSIFRETDIDAKAYGITLGQPLEVTTTITGAQQFVTDRLADVPIPLDATVGVAVGEPMDFPDYPLPPRPSVLPSLSAPQAPGAADLLVSDPADPLRPQTRRVKWNGSFATGMASATPGVLTMTVDGVEVTRCRVWDYSAEPCVTNWDVENKDKLRSKIGKTVTITVTPTYVTGPWQVSINHER